MLTLAAYYDHLEMMDLLLDAGASLSPTGGSPLDTAAAKGHENAVCRLIEAGAGPEAKAAALHMALRVWRPKIAELLIELEADVNALSIDKPLFRVVAADAGHEPGQSEGGAAAWPLARDQAMDADGTAGPQGQNRPLDYVLARGDHSMMRRLVGRGACSRRSMPATSIASSICSTTASRSRTSESSIRATALTSVAYAGNFEMVRLLVEHGADVDHRDQNQDAALTEAVHRGHTEIYHFLHPLTRDSEIRAEAEKLYRRRRGKRGS